MRDAGRGECKDVSLSLTVTLLAVPRREGSAAPIGIDNLGAHVPQSPFGLGFCLRDGEWFGHGASLHLSLSFVLVDGKKS